MKGYSLCVKKATCRVSLIVLFCLVIFLVGCREEKSNRIQGYVEGEFVYVASPFSGQLDKLAVSRGAEIQVGDLLFQLESGAEEANKKQAVERLAQGKAQLINAEKGLRPTELAALTAQSEQYQAALVLAERDFLRTENLFRQGVIAEQRMDEARTSRDRAQQLLAQAKSNIATGNLGARSDEVLAARANVAALDGALAYAEWALSQKRQSAPVAGAVFDVFYYQGEWVASGRPVVALLPPEARKVRAYLPEPLLSSLKIGQVVSVSIDGLPAPVTGKIAFISPRVEYTPPVIYSKDTRAKLCFMFEIHFAPETAKNLHPGQPVEVSFD